MFGGFGFSSFLLPWVLFRAPQKTNTRSTWIFLLLLFSILFHKLNLCSIFIFDSRELVSEYFVQKERKKSKKKKERLKGIWLDDVLSWCWTFLLYLFVYFILVSEPFCNIVMFAIVEQLYVNIYNVTGTWKKNKKYQYVGVFLFQVKPPGLCQAVPVPVPRGGPRASPPRAVWSRDFCFLPQHFSIAEHHNKKALR